MRDEIHRRPGAPRTAPQSQRPIGEKESSSRREGKVQSKSMSWWGSGGTLAEHNEQQAGRRAGRPSERDDSSGAGQKKQRFCILSRY